MVPDPGLAEGAVVHVLPDDVGRERAVRIAVPEALAATAKIKMVLRHVRSFLGGL